MNVEAAAYQAVREHGGWADLRARAKFRVTGANRLRYLNGQLTANLSRLTPGLVAPACVTTAKGKLSGEVFVSLRAEEILLDCDPELREPMLERLSRYIIADDVTIDDVSEELSLWHELLPAAAAESTDRAGLIARFGRPGRDLWTDTAAPAPGEAIPAALLESLRIEAGVPRWGAELGPDTLPPEAGLDRTHIDYHKGCYIGQETISRLKSVGHVNRSLTGFVATTDQPLSAGLLIFAPLDTVKPVGEITSAGWSFALAKPIALGYLKRGATGEGLSARPPAGDGPAIGIFPHALPFST